MKTQIIRFKLTFQPINANLRLELALKKKVKYFHDLANRAIDAMEEDVLNAMKMFALE